MQICYTRLGKFQQAPIIYILKLNNCQAEYLKYTDTPIKDEDGQWMNAKESNNQPWMHEKITKSDKMTRIFHLFCKDICKIDATVNMTDFDKTRKDVFSNTILLHLNMMKTFSCTTLWPGDTSLVIIIDGICRRHEKLFDLKKFQNLNQLKKKLHTFISGINLRFSRTTSRNSLSFREPMHRAKKINVKRRHGTRSK